MNLSIRARTTWSRHVFTPHRPGVGMSADVARKSACATVATLTKCQVIFALNLSIGFGIVACVALAAAQVEHPPMAPPAGPGVFTVKPSGPGTFKLVVTGHTFTRRGEIEKYLAYRAARLTVEQGGSWFTLNEDRDKGERAE